MKYIQHIVFILVLFTLSKVNSQAPSVIVYDMTYINGTPISLGGLIKIESGSNSRIQFAVQVNNPNGFRGTLKVYTKGTSSSSPVQRGGSSTIFDGETFFVSSQDLTLSASEFNTSGGKLYAEFVTSSGSRYRSGYYNISVYVDETTTDTDGDGVIDSQDNCPNQAGPASNDGCPENNCPKTRTITQQYTSGNTHTIRAMNSINFSGTLQNSSTIVKCYAGNSIKLGTGFKTRGGQFLAKIQECSSSSKFTQNKRSQETEGILQKTLKKEDIIKIYPNPTSSIVNISSTENIASWELSNHFGRIYIQDHAKSPNLKAFSLNLSIYPTGIYVLRTRLKNGELVIKKIIKE